MNINKLNYNIHEDINDLHVLINNIHNLMYYS